MGEIPLSKYNDIWDLLQSKAYQPAVDKLNQTRRFPINAGVKITIIDFDYAEGELVSSQSDELDQGLLLSLADEITGIAACSRGVPYVTISSSINFLRGTASGKVKCKAVPQRTGEDISVFQAVIIDEAESLLAIGTFAFQMKK